MQWFIFNYSTYPKPHKDVNKQKNVFPAQTILILHREIYFLLHTERLCNVFWYVLTHTHTFKSGDKAKGFHPQINLPFHIFTAS